MYIHRKVIDELFGRMVVLRVNKANKGNENQNYTKIPSHPY
jgi:hypothetical protein